VNLFCGQQRKGIAQRATDLRAEHGIGAGARAVGLEFSVSANMAQQIEVWNHCGKNLTTKRGPEKEIKPRETEKGALGLSDRSHPGKI
jgi:hypothetical protein